MYKVIDQELLAMYRCMWEKNIKHWLNGHGECSHNYHNVCLRPIRFGPEPKEVNESRKPCSECVRRGRAAKCIHRPGCLLRVPMILDDLIAINFKLNLTNLDKNSLAVFNDRDDTEASANSDFVPVCG